MDATVGSVEPLTNNLAEEKLASGSTAAARREAYLKHLTGQAKAAADESGLGLKPLRERALGLVSDRTFPHGKDEEWRFTDLTDLLALPLERAKPTKASSSVVQNAVPLASEHFLVTVNGYYDAELSATEKQLEGVVIAPLSVLLGNPAYSQKVGAAIASKLAQVQGGSEVFTALNTVGFADVMVVWVGAETAVDAPICIAHGSQDGAIAHLRTLVMAERHAELTLVESFWGDDEQPRCNNSVTEIWLEEGARVNHIRLQDEGDQTFHIAKTAVSQSANSRYQCTALDLGGQLSRHHLEVYQAGPQTDTHLYGLSALSNQQLADTHSLLTLTYPHGSATQIQKNVVDDRAHAVFNGRVYVARNAQLTNASQLNRNLLLSSKARIDTKPELDIVADDVKCAHGATVSQLQADEVFYLQSRGISAAQAQRLLLYGFAMEIVEKISVAPLREKLGDRISAWTR